MTMRLLLVIALEVAAGVAHADPTVPGFVVTPYATVTDPASLAFASDGTLYAGRDATGSGGGSGDAVKIHRIAPGGTPVEEFGDAALFDPDGVLVDETGAISGTPGAVLVCGQEPSGQGTVSAIAPDQSITTVLGPTATLVNPNYMALDSTGALLISSTSGVAGVYRFPAGGPLALFLDPGGNSPDNLAVDATGRIFVHLGNGNVAVYAAGGTVENAAFATGLGTSAALVVGRGGVWGTDLYAGVDSTGELVRIDDQGMATSIGTGFTSISGIAFGPDNALYVSEFANDRVLRIASPGPTTSTVTTTSTTTTVSPSSSTTSTTSSTTSTSSTTASSSSSSTSSSTSTSSTTRSPATTTSTTLAGCLGVPAGPTFASVICRLEALLARVSGESGLHAFQPKLAHTLGKGRDRASEARDFCAASNAKKSKARLKQVGRALIQYVHRLAGLSAQKKLDDMLRRDFLDAGKAIEPDVGTLRKNLRCPADAAT